MAPHSSILAWKIPWTEEPDGPQSKGCCLKCLVVVFHSLDNYLPFGMLFLVPLTGKGLQKAFIAIVCVASEFLLSFSHKEEPA